MKRIVALGLVLLAAGPALAKKLNPVYPIDELHVVDAATRIVIVPPRIDITTYSGVERRLDETAARVADWLIEIAEQHLRAMGLATMRVSPHVGETSDRIRAIADQYVGARRGPDADAELLRALGAGPRPCAVLLQHLEVRLASRGYWNSFNGQLGVGMSNSDLRGALLDCDTGELLWRGELYYRDVPDVDSGRWKEIVTGMYANLENGR